MAGFNTSTHLRRSGRLQSANLAPASSFRGALLYGATIVLSLAWEGGASAQVIDQYLNAGIPGYDTQAGVTVTSRSRPEYNSTGVKLGNFVVSPSLEESFGYDDNVTGRSRGAGSALVQTNAAVGLAGGWSDTKFGAGLTLDNHGYLSETNQSFTNWSAALGGSHEFGRDQLSIGYTHLNLNQTPRDLDVPGLDQSIAYRVDDLRANYHIDLGHIFIQPGLDVSYYSFDNGRAGGQTYLQNYRDRVVLSPELVGSYEFATRRRVVVILRDTQSDFDHAPPGAGRQNFNDVSALAGISYDADGIVSFRLLAGYEHRSFASSQYRTISAPIVEGSVSWTPTGLTTITGTAARYIEDSAAEATTGFTETALKLQADHELFRNVILSAHASFFIDDYTSNRGSNGGSQDYFTGGVGASYALTRRLRLGADYTYSTRHASGAGAPVDAFQLQGNTIFGGNYSENTFRVTVRVAL